MRYFATGCFLLAMSALSSCTYNPQTAPLSKKDQCLTMQRQMLFVGNFRNNDSQWSNQVDRQQLKTNYDRLNCDDVLGKKGKS